MACRMRRGPNARSERPTDAGLFSAPTGRRIPAIERPARTRHAAARTGAGPMTPAMLIAMLNKLGRPPRPRKHGAYEGARPAL